MLNHLEKRRKLAVFPINVKFCCQNPQVNLIHFFKFLLVKKSIFRPKRKFRCISTNAAITYKFIYFVTTHSKYFYTEAGETPNIL